MPEPVLITPSFLFTDSSSSDSQSAEKDELVANNAQIEDNAQFIKDSSGITWIVEPVLDYENIIFCFICGYTANSYAYIIDELTGQIEREHLGHGGPHYLDWVYDFEENLIGSHLFGWDEEVVIHPADQFSEHFFSYSNMLNYVRLVDSSEITVKENDWWISYDLGEKYSNSRYAIMYGSTFLTDFIFDEPDSLSIYHTYKNAIPVTRDGKWGFINTKGDLFIPLIFDHIATSNGDTAFVKVDGKYGIIDVRASVYLMN